MQHLDRQLPDESLRAGLDRVAAEAGPLGFTAARVVARVRGRRRRTVLGATVAAMAVVVGAVASFSVFRGAPQEGTVVGEPSVSPSSTGPAGAPPKVFRCGERLNLADAADSRSGLTMALSTVRRQTDDVGPELRVSFTGTVQMSVTSSPPNLFEVLYLKQGVIVGGGPMLNLPGDDTAQGLDLIGHAFEVAPGSPSVQELGPRDTLCPSLTWRQVWSAPGEYEVVVLQGPVERLAAGTSIGVPALDLPLLVTRATFAT